jgi:O-acetylhomoserine (thiol)-lyase
MTESGAKFDTLALHAGQRPDPTTGARAVPIHQTTSYVFPTSDEAAALFDLGQPGHVYSRISNPTVAVFEERIAALEGGIGAVATASGQAALHLAIATLMGAGGHIVASRALYGGSINLLGLTLPRFRIETSFVDPRDPKAFAAAIRAETRLVFLESIGNPGLEIPDIPAIAALAHEAGIPLLVDSTFATPYLFRPFSHGADLVVHSATKWLGGHGTAIGGVLVDSGRFDWLASDRFPTLTEPYAGYAGLNFAEDFGPAAFLGRARGEGLRDFGAAMAPMTAFQLLQGIETLPLRMARHVENTARVLAFLVGHAGVAWVNHPSLPGHLDHGLGAKLMPRGQGSVLTFGPRGGGKAGRALVDALRLISHLANVGDAKTLVIHPASTTHRQLDPVALARAGIGEDMIRLSVGLEDPEDLIADLTQALRQAAKV